MQQRVVHNEYNLLLRGMSQSKRNLKEKEDQKSRLKKLEEGKTIST